MLSFDEFRDLLRTGYDPEDPPGGLLQVTLWPVFSQMTRRDRRTMYEYLRSIPSFLNTPTPGP